MRNTILLALFLLLPVTAAAQTGTLSFDDAFAAVDRQDYESAFAGFRVLAEQGHPIAQLNLGLMYKSGHGTNKDYRAAVSWFTKSAKVGYPRAQRELGVMYLDGLGVQKNLEDAEVWFRLAAEADDAWGQYFVGLLSIGKNNRQSFEYLLKAANKGLASAQYQLGMMYGIGTEAIPKDEQISYYWFLLARIGGYKDAETVIDSVARKLSIAQKQDAQSSVRNWIAEHTPELTEVPRLRGYDKSGVNRWPTTKSGPTTF